MGAVFPLPEPADLVIASHFTFDDISGDIVTLETKLKGVVCEERIGHLSLCNMFITKDFNLAQISQICHLMRLRSYGFIVAHKFVMP